LDTGDSDGLANEFGFAAVRLENGSMSRLRQLSGFGHGLRRRVALSGGLR